MIDLEKILGKYYQADQSVILWCSAWPDSMFLLYKLMETKYKQNLVVCYFNHQLQEQSLQEEQFLEDFCKTNSIQFESAKADIKGIKEKIYPGKSIEEVARDKRYQFFDAICNIYNSNIVITGHHLDDKIETFYFNLNRWSKLTGLINMTEFHWGVLRPLLWIEKEEIETYLKKNRLTYFIDTTNFDTDITRNKIRHDIVPQFKYINKNYKKNIQSTLNYFEELKNHIDLEVISFLDSQETNTTSKLSFNLEEFKNISSFLQKEIIRYIYYVSNGKSTIGLSEWNIAEVIKFLFWKNNKTKKQIQKLDMFKDGNIIYY